jgi:2,4-dienoyl-CoA reductase-like NADH-dependent reductase (Old Yellow Enzyme family)/thioredoxin reductase
MIAAGATSASALALNKLAGGAAAPVFQAGTASAAERSVAGGENAGFSDRYQHLLTPLRIRNVVLKNRMISPNALPHYLQGPEVFPADPMLNHYANVARNGAAVVTFRGCLLGSAQNKMFDIDNSGVQNYLAQLADAIHFYDSKANVALTIDMEPAGYDISDTLPADPSAPMVAEKYRMTGDAKEIPLDKIEKMIADITALAKQYKDLGWDMVNLYMSYRSSILANSLSPAMNRRTDKYGGSLKNRAQLTIDLCQSIKSACGQDFLIEAQVSGQEEPGGYAIDDLIQYTKLWEGSVDILQIRDWDGRSSHPMGYNSKKGHPATLQYAEAIKKSGTSIVVAPVGGFQDLDLNEEYIASGKTDLVCMGRAFICDPEYGRKADEGRGEDVVPCILCNKCHGNANSPNIDVCSVNPALGLAHKVNRMVALDTTPKRVAVIGGGPAGMRAAVTAAERGHSVTLYEKNGTLGGQLLHADHVSFQWPLKDFKDWLIRQVKKNGIEVHLNNAATPERIKSGGFDAVLVAAGAEPVVSRIPGADGGNVYNVLEVFGNEKKMGKKVVVIGANQIGSQTGMHLALSGCKVTVLATGNELMPMEGPHQNTDVYEEMENFSWETRVMPKSISKGKVIYTDAQGKETSIPADSVVIFSGFKPKLDEAMTFAGCAPRVTTIGDCLEVGGFLRACNRTAFAAAVRI